MGIFSRMANGWEIAKTSMKVLNANRQLIIFPILSGLTLGGVIASSIYYVYSSRGEEFIASHLNNTVVYSSLFCFYIVSYFIIAFFNMALIHCTHLYFKGEEASVSKGLSFSAGRIGRIFAWSVFAATVGTVLRAIQDNLGWLGRILISIVGIAWSVGTFFVVPILAYEDLGPIDAFKKSVEMMKKEWGETIGANFSLNLVGGLIFLIIGIIGAVVSSTINEQLGIYMFVFGALAAITITSALSTIFVSAVYHHVTGDLNDHFNQQILEGLFEER